LASRLFKQALEDLCERCGLRPSLVVEQALREKVEDLVDTHDLAEAQRTAGSFRSWDDVERDGASRTPS
jgi:hypothetical protein